MGASLRLYALLCVARAAVFDRPMYNGCAFVDHHGVVTRYASTGEVCACGASLPDKLYQMGALAYAAYSPVSYAATGSTNGKDSVINAAVDFAGSDSLLDDADYEAMPDLQMYPATAAAVVPVINLRSLVNANAKLIVDRSTLPLIFLGDIFEWTDPRLLKLQDNATAALLLEMADPSIRVVVRNDGSGTTEIFTKALSAFSGDFARRVGGDDVLDWCEDGMEALPCLGEAFTNGTCDANKAKINCFGIKGECEGVQWLQDSGFDTSGRVTCLKESHEGRSWSYTRGTGTGGLIAAVQSLQGSIGYAVLADVKHADLEQATIINQAGVPLIADTTSISFALLELGGFLDARGNGVLYDALGPQAYPIVGFTYFIVRKGFVGGESFMDEAPEMFDCATRRNTLALLEWYYSSDEVDGITAWFGFSELPLFISESLVEDIRKGNFCLEKGVVTTVAFLETVSQELLYAVETAVDSMIVVTSVYEETDSSVVWNVAPATNTFALNRSFDDSLGVGAFFEKTKPVDPHFFAAPLYTAGVGAQYHLGEEIDDLSLTHEDLAGIFTCTIKTWRDLRPDLPNEPIQLVVRTDECPSNEIFTESLSYHVPAFKNVIGETSKLNGTFLRELGCFVVAEVQSDTQVESAITFHDFSLGMWTMERLPAAKLAGFKPMHGRPVVLNASALARCVEDPKSAVSFTSKKYGFRSNVYDLSHHGIEAGSSSADAPGCWPYSRAFSMVISEELLGPSQCPSSENRRLGNRRLRRTAGEPQTPSEQRRLKEGPEQALDLMRWIYAGEVYRAMAASFFLEANFEDRLRVSAVLDTWPLNFCDPDESEADVLPEVIFVAALCALGLALCAGVFLVHVRYQQSLTAQMRAQATVRLPEDVQEVLDQVWSTVKEQDAGGIADYIPELAAVDAVPFAIVVCDLQRGQLYEAGDATKRFTFQSACKPLLYCLALEDRGQEAVDKLVGTEPTGAPFDVISFDAQGRPCNPYINAGAICTAALIDGETATARFRRISKLFDSMSLGSKCGTGLDDAVFKSEMANNGNNRTIVREGVSRGLIESDFEGGLALEAYTMACSLSVDTREVACVAATLANHGTNPQTGEEVMPPDVVQRVLSTMMTCGMYNGAGAWMVDVGIPAKSGVSGVIMCVVPGVCGFAAFSPRLDANGNSTRGVLVARSVSEILGLHVLHQGGGKPGNDGSRSKKSHPARKKMLAAARAETAHHSDRSLHLSDRDLREPGDARAGSQRDLVGSGRDLRARPSDRDVRLTPRGRPARIEPLANFGGEHAGDEESKGGDPQDDVRLAEEP